ncbi:MAG: hypothetical protein ACJLTB_21625 [Algoriphagus aquaeductus]|uniref:hypothetical protein n=1 Tax=Algoriphagus aquaeductus TaxID=475299 RepID=UPI00387933F5
MKNKTIKITIILFIISFELTGQKLSLRDLEIVLENELEENDSYLSKKKYFFHEVIDCRVQVISATGL